MTQPHCKKILYEENTREYLDRVCLQKSEGSMIKGGRKLINSILLFCIYSSILIYLVVHYAIIERYFDITNPILYVLLAALIFISALLKVELKLFLTTDKLKVYSDGLSLPRRTFSENENNPNERFI